MAARSEARKGTSLRLTGPAGSVLFGNPSNRVAGGPLATREPARSGRAASASGLLEFAAAGLPGPLASRIAARQGAGSASVEALNTRSTCVVVGPLQGRRINGASSGARGSSKSHKPSCSPSSMSKHSLALHQESTGSVTWSDNPFPFEGKNR